MLLVPLSESKRVTGQNINSALVKENSLPRVHVAARTKFIIPPRNIGNVQDLKIMTLATLLSPDIWVAAVVLSDA